jgi:hypothetical protein
MGLAIISKENGVLVPLYILVFELMLFKFHSDALVKDHFRLLFYSVCVVPLVIGSMFFLAKADRLLAGYSDGSVAYTITERLLSESVILVGYLRSMVLPDLNSMSLYQDFWPIQENFNNDVLLSLFVLVGLLLLGILLVRVNRLAALGVFVFFVAHCLESSIFPLALAFEHRNYFASFGVVLCTVSVVFQFSSRVGSGRRVFHLFVVIAVTMLSIQSLKRNVVWSDDRLLNATAVKNYPGSYASRTWHAASLAKRGNVFEAKQQLSEAHKIRPQHSYPVLATTLLDCLSKRSTKQQVVQLADDLPEMIFDVSSLSTLLDLHRAIVSGACNEVEPHAGGEILSAAYFHDSKRLSPHLNSILAFEFSGALMAGGDREEAQQVVNSMLAENPHNAMALVRQGAIYAVSGEAGELKSVVQRLDDLKYSDRNQYQQQIEQLREMYVSMSD